MHFKLTKETDNLSIDTDVVYFILGFLTVAFAYVMFYLLIRWF